MKALLLMILFPVCGFAQYDLNEKLRFKATVVTDSSTIKGYFVYNIDSAVILSPQKRYSPNSTINIPTNTIKEFHLKNKKIYWAGVSAATILGFVVTAGLTKNAGDFDNDGKTSFFELILTAIEGSTSSNKRRRKTALIVGAAGGTAGLLISLFANRNFSLIFPISNRNNFYSEKKYELRKFVNL